VLDEKPFGFMSMVLVQLYFDNLCFRSPHLEKTVKYMETIVGPRLCEDCSLFKPFVYFVLPSVLGNQRNLNYCHVLQI
jgi:hypothetical protein